MEYHPNRMLTQELMQRAEQPSYITPEPAFLPMDEVHHHPGRSNFIRGSSEWSSQTESVRYDHLTLSDRDATQGHNSIGDSQDRSDIDSWLIGTSADKGQSKNQKADGQVKKTKSRRRHH